MQTHAPRLQKGELAAMTPEARKAHLKAQAERYYTQRYKRRRPKQEGKTKLCWKCNTGKPATQEFFYANKNLKSGLASWCRSCVHEAREGYRILKKYKMTRPEYEALFKGASCAICKTDKRLVMDHCHEMETPRGILCSECNAGLGMFKDDPEAMEAAAAYIREHRSHRT